MNNGTGNTKTTTLKQRDAARTLKAWQEETTRRASTGRAGDTEGIVTLIDRFCGALADLGHVEEAWKIRGTLDSCFPVG